MQTQPPTVMERPVTPPGPDDSQPSSVPMPQDDLRATPTPATVTRPAVPHAAPRHDPTLMRLTRLALALGPGILAMAADNDAGGLLSYATTGAVMGVRFFLAALIPLAILTYTVQEMATRLGIVTGRSLPDLVRETAGDLWARVLAIDLALQNTATLVAEFAGMTFGLSHFGIPVPVGALIAFALIGTVLLVGSYQTAETVGLTLVAVNLMLIPLALRHVGLAAVNPWPSHLELGAPLFTIFAVGLAGNAIAPWMPFFQADAVHSHRNGPISLKSARVDLAFGTAIQVVVAGAVLLMAASVRVGSSVPMGVWLTRLGHADGGWAGDMFAIGLFDAGFVAALTVSFSSAWTVVHTWSGRVATVSEPETSAGTARPRHDLIQRIRRAPATYGIFAAGLTIAALSVMVPGAPLALYAVGTQALSALLMPPIIFVLWLLTRRSDLLGRFRSHIPGTALALLALFVFGGASIWLLMQG